MRHQLIQYALGSGHADGQGAGYAGGAAGLADVAVRALRLLFVQLEPLLGKPAVRGIYVRSLHLANSSFEQPASQGEIFPEELLGRLRTDLASRSSADALRAAEALLDALTALLVSLIGKSLTRRLLSSAWGNPAAEEPIQEKPL